MEKELVYVIKCLKCKEVMSIEATQEQDEQLEKGETKIQNIFPELSPDECELLISGICGTCYDRMFAQG